MKTLKCLVFEDLARALTPTRKKEQKNDKNIKLNLGIRKSNLVNRRSEELKTFVQV